MVGSWDNCRRRLVEGASMIAFFCNARCTVDNDHPIPEARDGTEHFTAREMQSMIMMCM